MKKSFLTIVLILSTLAWAAAKVPITFDEFIKMKRLNHTALSPDGKLLAYDVGVPDLAANKIRTQVWILDTATGETRQMTNHEKNSNAAKFSPDGKWLYFLTSRNGTRNIYRLPLSGGEAQAVTKFELDVNSYLPLKDGNFIVSLNIFKDCGADTACTDKKLKEADDNPVQAKLITAPYYRVFDEWQNGTLAHLFLWTTADGKLKDLTPDEQQVPPMSLGNDYPYAVSPDEAELAYTANRSPHIERSTNHDVFLRNLKSGAVVNLTEANHGQDCGPVYSPDGKWLAFARMKREGFEADKQDLMLYDRQKKAFANLTEKEDLSVTEYQFSPDSRAVFYTCENHGRHWIYKVDVANGKIKPLMKDMDGDALSPGAGAVYFMGQTTALPKEVFALDPSSGKSTQHTFTNRAILEKLDMRPIEEVSWKSTDGTQVWGFILKPPGFNPAKKYPLLVLVHGGPQGTFGDDFHYRWNAQMFAAPGYVVFMPNFRGSTSYGEKYKDAISLHWGDLPYQDIMSGVDYVTTSSSYVDPTRKAAAGASYGGYMINWMATQTDRFRCLVSHAGLWDLYSEYGTTEELWFPEWEYGGDPYTHPDLYKKWSPSTFALNLKTPMLIVHGGRDFRVGENQAFQIFQALQRLGVESKMLYFPDETHFVAKPKNAQLWWTEVMGFIAEHLK